MSLSFEWSPYLPQIYYIILALLGAGAIVFAFTRRMRDFSWRGFFFLLLVFALLNPIILHELRDSLPDKLIVILDDSPSERVGGRDKVAEAALAHLTAELAKTNVEPVVLRSSADTSAGKGESTNLFGVLRNNLMSVPASQVAGTVMITDGEVHDVPKDLGVLKRMGPFHVILTGKKDEFDRKVTIVNAPKYGVLNENVTISVRIDEFGRTSETPTTVTVKQDGQTETVTSLQPGETRDFTFRVAHPGQNIIEFAIPVEGGELTASNNTAPVIVNGIRDRMRVLLVSGSPHMGERSWRNLLKSDPAVDLVHFTILRSPDSMDMTPQSQMSLIAFPVDELFQKKINDFDLIIFDRYQSYGMLMSPVYFSSIAQYIRRGGAFLMALGTGEGAEQGFSFQNSGLQELIPVAPNVNDPIMKLPFRPQLTDLGMKHPITADLMRQLQQKMWGQWLSQASVSQLHGQELMTGIDKSPLLVIDKVGDGRVAVLASDNIWLWSKGVGQSGPYTDLLRNLAHWLMKEPELEDDFIKAEAKGNTITVAERDLTPDVKQVMMTKPSGEQSLVTLNVKEPGWIKAEVAADDNGIYGFDNGVKKAFAVVGSARNEEFADVHTTDEKLKPVVDASKGALIWYQENQGFKLRDVTPDAGSMGSDDWLGLKRNSAYTISNVESLSLMPNSLTLLVILAGALLMWWRESGRRS
ncbi:MAG: glutamine amidotransferase [Micavibrio sp.]|nr:glutamine amidotransferase [Micavibrio sp.]